MKNSIKRSHLSILVIVLLLMTGITLGELSLFIFKPYAVVAESINNIINMNDDSFYYNGNRYALNHGSIINCRSINFTVYTRCSKGYVGGIVAENYGLVENCWAYNEVTTSGKFGGITAENHDNGIIKNCSVFGTVNLYIDNINNEYTITYAGDIAGINSGEISNCKIGGMDDEYLKFIVHVDYVNDKNLKPYIGTACGYNKGKITDCQRISFILDTGNLHSFKEWFKTYNQQSNINNDLG